MEICLTLKRAAEASKPKAETPGIFQYGQVVSTHGGRLGLVTGTSRFSVIVVPVVRGIAQRRTDIPTAGKIFWHDPESSMSGYVRAHMPILWPESLLFLAGEAEDALMADVLRAQIRELETDDEPPDALGWEAREPVREAMAMSINTNC